MLYTKNDWKFMVRFASKAVSAVLAVVLIAQSVPQVFATGGAEASLGRSSVESTQRDNVRLGHKSLLAAISGEVPDGYQVVDINDGRDLANLAARVNAGEFASPSSVEIGNSDLVPGTSDLPGRRPVYVRLNKDINLMAPDAAGGTPSVYWEPIGTSENPFTGIFNGQGHLIYGLDTDMESANTLFGYLLGATVQNVQLAPAQDLGRSDDLTVEELFYRQGDGETFYNVTIVPPSDTLQIENGLMDLTPEYDWFYESNRQERELLKKEQEELAAKGETKSLLELAVSQDAVDAAEAAQAEAQAQAQAQAESNQVETIAQAMDTAPWVEQMQPRLVQGLRFNANGIAVDDRKVQGSENAFTGISSGAEENKKYYISKIEELQGLSNLVAKGHTFTKQVVIINQDLDGKKDDQGGRKEFKPIGSALVHYPTGDGTTNGTIGQTGKQHTGFYPYFAGRLVGAKGKTTTANGDNLLNQYATFIPYNNTSIQPIRVKNVKFVPSQTGDACGLFANSEHAIIENLIFENCASNGVSWVGMVTGLSGNTVLNRIGVEGGEVTGSSEVGGLVGFNRTPFNDDLKHNSSSIGAGSTMVWANGNQTNPVSYVGNSMNGNWWEKAQFFNSYCTASVTGSQNVGGIIGFTESSVHATGGVIGCIFSGNLVGQVNVGGIMGNQSMTHNTLYISHCATSGTISGTAGVGGIVGFFQEVGDTTSINNTCKIQYCYSSATITGASNVGGIVGTVSAKAPNQTQIKKNYFSGQITSTQLSAYTVTASAKADLSKITIGPILGSGMVKDNSGNLTMYDNYYCRTCYSELQYEGGKPTDEQLKDTNSGIGKWLLETHKTQSCNAKTGTTPSDCRSNNSALVFDNRNNLIQGDDIQHWQGSTLKKHNQEWYYSHGHDVTGNHPQLKCFEQIKFGYADGIQDGNTMFKAFSDMSTLANMAVPSELTFAALGTGNGNEKTYNGTTYKYTLTETQNGTTQYKYTNPQGVSGWRVDSVEQGITLIPNTDKMTTNGTNNEKMQNLQILDETVPGNFINILVVQSTNGNSNITVYADYPPSRDLPLKVYTMAEDQQMGIGYDLTIKDSALRLQEDEAHMPAALLPTNLNNVTSSGSNANGKYLSVYDKAFVFRFPTHETINLTDAEVKIYKKPVGNGYTFTTPNNGSTGTNGEKLVAQGKGTTNGAGTGGNGNDVVTLELSTGPANVLRVTSKDNKEIIEPNHYYQFVLTVKDTAGKPFVTTKNTLDGNVTNGNYYVGRSYDDMPPKITMKDPDEKNTNALEYIEEGDPVKQHYDNNWVTSGELTKEMVTANGNLPGQKFSVGGPLKWNDEANENGTFDFKNNAKVKYQVLRLTVGEENAGVYTRGVVTDDGVDPISLVTKDSDNKDLIKLQILSGGKAPGTQTDATLETFQEIAGTYRIVYQVKDIRGKFADAPVVRYYIVYQSPQMVVTEDINKGLTYDEKGLPKTGLGQNGAAKSYTAVDFTLNEVGMHQLADMFYLQLKQNAGMSEAVSQALNVAALQSYGQFCIYQQTNEGIRYMIPQVNRLPDTEVAKLFTPNNPNRVLEATYALYYAVDPATRQSITTPITDFDPVKLLQMVGGPVEGFEKVPVRIRIPGSLSSMLSVGIPNAAVETDAAGNQTTTAFKSDSEVASALKTQIAFADFRDVYHGNIEEAIADKIGAPVMYWNAQQTDGKYKVIGTKEGLKGKWEITKAKMVDGSTSYKAVYRIENVYGLALQGMGISINSGSFTLTVAADPNADNVVGVTAEKVDSALFWDRIGTQIEYAQPGAVVSAKVPYELRYIPVQVLRKLKSQQNVTLEMTLEDNIVVKVNSADLDLSKVPTERGSYNIYVGGMNNLWITRDSLGYNRHFQQFYTDAADERTGVADQYYGDITITMPLDRELQDSKNIQLYTYSNQNRTYTWLQNVSESSIDREAGTVTLKLKGVPYGEYILGSNLNAPVLNPSTGGYALEGEETPEHILIQAVASGLLENKDIVKTPVGSTAPSAVTPAKSMDGMVTGAIVLIGVGGLGVLVYEFLRRKKKTDPHS